jgi:hypothetical protein
VVFLSDERNAFAAEVRLEQRNASCSPGVIWAGTILKSPGADLRRRRLLLFVRTRNNGLSNGLVITLAAAGRTNAYNSAKAHSLLSTLIEACAS